MQTLLIRVDTFAFKDCSENSFGVHAERKNCRQETDYCCEFFSAIVAKQLLLPDEGEQATTLTREAFAKLCNKQDALSAKNCCECNEIPCHNQGKPEGNCHVRFPFRSRERPSAHELCRLKGLLTYLTWGSLDLFERLIDGRDTVAFARLSAEFACMPLIDPCHTAIFLMHRCLKELRIAEIRPQGFLPSRF